MGCDIHCYVEYQTHAPHWSAFGERINPGRDYELFGNLAGVRGGEALIPPRGLPEDATYTARSDASLWITETAGEGYVTPADAARYVASGDSVYLDNKNRVTHPDWHSHSWLTVAEFEQAINKTRKDPYPVSIEYLAVLAAMKSLESNGAKTRIVFWFDN